MILDDRSFRRRLIDEEEREREEEGFTPDGSFVRNRNYVGNGFLWATESRTVGALLSGRRQCRSQRACIVENCRRRQGDARASGAKTSPVDRRIGTAPSDRIQPRRIHSRRRRRRRGEGKESRRTTLRRRRRRRPGVNDSLPVGNNQTTSACVPATVQLTPPPPPNSPPALIHGVGGGD